MFSNALMTSCSADTHWGPYKKQNVSCEVGKDHIFCHTNLLDTPSNPMFTFLFVRHYYYYSITNLMGSWSN
jgi:hypothetical protein